MQQLPVVLMTEVALQQRRAELSRARRRLDSELERINAVLAARAPKPRTAAEHGSQAGYRAHKRIWLTEPCDRCRAAHATYNAAQRSRRDLEQASRALDGSPVPTQRTGDARDAH